jgi:hypothetical protein
VRYEDVRVGSSVAFASAYLGMNVDAEVVELDPRRLDDGDAVCVRVTSDCAWKGMHVWMGHEGLTQR